MAVDKHEAALEVIELSEILGTIWRRKWQILAATVAFAFVAWIRVAMMQDVYKSEALLAPSQKDSTGALSGLISQYSALSQIAGINLGTVQSDRTAYGLALLRSRKLIMGVIERNDLLVPLLAAKKWNPDSNQLVIDEDIYDVAQARWHESEWPNGSGEPSLLDGYEEFVGNLNVKLEKDTGLIRVSVTHVSPVLAQQWVELLVQSANELVMDQDRTKAAEAVEYLRELMRTTAFSELRSVFSRLVEEQLKVVMLAEISPEYLFVTVDPAIVAEKKDGPDRLLATILGALLGMVLSTVALVLFAYYRRVEVEKTAPSGGTG